MLNTLELYTELKEEMSEKTARILVNALNLIYEEQRNRTTKEEFNELKKIMRELAAAQKETEKQVRELIVAQKKTEQRIEELAVAQKKTEERVDILTERLDKLTEEVRELAAAQKETEQEVMKLAKQVGGLSHSVGYFLEDKIIPKLPGLLKEEYNFEKVYEMKRTNIEYEDGRYDEVNIFGEGERDGKEVIIIGECKVNLSKNDIYHLEKKIERIQRKFKKEIFKIIVAAHCSPHTEKLVKEKNIEFIHSYELDERKKYLDKK